MVAKYKCPICKELTAWENNPSKPFCSPRCKLIDLGKWADGSYSLQSDEPADVADVQPDDPTEMIH